MSPQDLIFYCGTADQGTLTAHVRRVYREADFTVCWRLRTMINGGDWWWRDTEPRSHLIPVTSASKKNKEEESHHKQNQTVDREGRPSQSRSLCVCVVLRVIWLEPDSWNRFSSLFPHSREKITPSDIQTREHVDSTLGINSGSCWLVCHPGGSSVCTSANLQ